VSVAEILDDLDSRPGSATSLLRTTVGVSLRELGGWIALPHLLELMAALGVSAPRARTAVARVKKRGLLVPEARGKVAGYALAPDATGMLERGDRRIYHPRTMTPDSAWCALSFSIPENRRDQRHQLRRRLHWIGFGTISPALWIGPEYLADEVEEILGDLGLREYATVLISEAPRVAGSLEEAVARWWDLDALRAHHEEFLAQHEADAAPPAEGLEPREAFGRYIRSIDSWRVIPYVDPGLPPELLPADWPGERSSRLFRTLHEQLAEPSAAFVRQAFMRKTQS
jgi:phenylacetic acid degradation operon negative regulatory protein